MALSKKPTTGMKDILPEEMQIRDYVISVIKDTYGKFGFTSIETPCVENIANLSSKQGGDNEKLIFKILKRGEKLNVAAATTEEEVVDSGLRYDLTVPLVRYYSNNAASLPSPFKALQMGNVWRADRPQRGRYRQFMQCDIDILGEPSNLAEIELILATTTTLGKLGFKNFQIRINERRILKAMAAYSGFPEESYDSVFITLDKMDKIGMVGVEEELLENGFDQACVDKYLNLFLDLGNAEDGVAYLADTLEGFLEPEIAQSLREIMDSVKATKASDFEIVFDATLVRGMSYYTGTIFEIAMPEFGGSCGGVHKGPHQRFGLGLVDDVLGDDADEEDVHAVHPQDLVGGEQSGGGVFDVEVGVDDGKAGTFFDEQQVCDAVIHLVVADGDDVRGKGVHDLDGGKPLVFGINDRAPEHITCNGVDGVGLLCPHLFDVAGQHGNAAHQFFVHLLCQKVSVQIIGVEDGDLFGVFHGAFLPVWVGSGQPMASCRAK